MFQNLGNALGMAFAMTWEILWALILGFTLSGIVQAVVSKSEMSRLLPDDSPRTLGIACGLGAASSSCSYAAVALSRSMFRKGANFTAAMAFELASTNLVAELGIILAVLMGWRFTLAEFVGGPLMVAVMAVLFRLFLRDKLIAAAREQANKGVAGKMEGHAEMDMAVTEGPLLRRIFSEKGRTASSRGRWRHGCRRHDAGPCGGPPARLSVCQRTICGCNCWSSTPDVYPRGRRRACPLR
jgi:uncharacterized membrane protein YraQ (UPF0718 family)